MKILFFIVLLANVLVFIWQYPQQMRPQVVAESAPAAQQSVPRLQLVSELVAELTPSATDGMPTPDTAVAPQEQVAQTGKPAQLAPDAMVPVPAAPVCYELGPYHKATQADGALAWLKRQGWSGQRRERSEKVLAGYRVLLPQQLTQVSASKLLERLKEQGVKDVAILVDDGRHIISLGYFSQKSSVDRRQREMKRLGYDILTSPSYRQQIVYFLDVQRSADDKTLSTVMAYLQKSAPAVSAEKVKCR